MHENKQKQLGLHAHAQEWKSLEHHLNIEPLKFPEQGIERYETALKYKQSLDRDIGLRDEKIRQLENEFNLIQMPEDRTVSDMYHLYQQESDIKQSELKAKALKRK